MRRLLFTCCLFFVLSLAFAQAPDYADYVRGSAEVDSATVTFYLENASDCRLDTVDVRVAHNSVYLTTDEASLNVDLAPGEIGTFVMRLNRVASADWQWALDGASLSDCDEAGTVSFDKVSFGEGLPVPGSAAVTTSPVVYTIKKGDTLFSIADEFGVTARQIMDANGLNNEALIFGRTLNIPVAGGGTAATTTTASNGDFSLHTVTTGDTLYSLSQQYATSVPLIEQANCMNASSVLTVGNQLRIPPAGVTEIADDCN